MPLITINGYTAEKMDEIIAQTIASAEVVGDDLIFERHDATTFNAGSVRGPAGTIASGSYTPTLVGMAIGTSGGAINAATYAFAGGPNVNDVGLLSLQGEIKFGSSGATLPSGATTTIGLPSGFNVNTMLTLGNPKVGLWDWLNASWAQTHFLSINSITTLKLGVANAGGNVTHRLVGDNVGATSPGTWVSGNTVIWHANFIAKRV